jgi:5-hydroxyisourate hydrolase-like protein (transthyretin family)
MRRPAVLVSILAAVAALALVPAPAEAAPPVTGRLVSTSNDHPPAAGMQVRLRTMVAGHPGSVVDTDLTDSNGRFSLDAGSAPEDEYFVQVVAGRYQGGWVGGSHEGAQPRPADAATYAPGTALGRIWVNPAFMRGVVVDSETRRPLRGIKVAARSHNDSSQPLRTDVTNRNGVFLLTGLSCEDDCFLRVNGTNRGYEVGYRACNASVVPTWGEACGAPLGRIGRVRLDRL